MVLTKGLKNTGFTLIELIIITGVSIIAGAILIGILINNSSLIFNQSTKVSQGLGINDSLANIKSYIKQAESVSVNYPETPPAIYNSSESQLVLRLAVTNQSGEIVANAFDFAVYFIDSKNLRFILFTDPQSVRISKDIILAKDVESVKFDYLDSLSAPTSPQAATNVRVSLTLKQTTGLERHSITATSEAQLRND